MKRNAILAGSLLVNAALVAGYFVMRPAPPPVAPSAEVSTDAAPRARASRAARTSSTVVTNDFKWLSIESEDYREYIENLRSIGCPEDTIRDIIIADVNKLYGTRIAALYPGASDFKFWVSERQNRASEREREQKIRELQREKRQLLKDLLGIDVDEELAKWTGRPDEDEVRYGFLSLEKQQALKALQAKYRDLERALFSEGGGFNPENRAKLNALRAQREAEMAQLLTPEENEQYQLRNSWTARNMRESLGAFEPTEWEFKEVFKLRKAYDDQFRFTREGSDEATREARRAAEQQAEQQIRSVLGEERYAQYQMANDDRFRDVYDWTQRANLPRSTAESIYDVRRIAEEQRNLVRRDQTMTPDQQNAILEQLLAETKNTLRTTLNDNYQEFENNSRWLRNFATPDSGRGRQRGPGPDFGPGDRREFRRNPRG
jgi:hypothetical protein